MGDNIYSEARRATQETTTSGDIAFAPQMGFSAPSKADKDLLKDKRNKRRSLGVLSKRQQKLKEDFDERVPALKKKIVETLDRIIKESRLSAGAFVTVFPRHNKDITGNTALIKYQSMPQDEAKLQASLPDDVGELELIDAAVNEKRSLVGYDPFDEAKHVFGAKVVAQEHGVNMMYEGMIDKNFAQREYLYIGDFDIVERAEKEIGGVKSSHRVLYPVGGAFRPDFYRQLKELITGGEKNVKGINGKS